MAYFGLLNIYKPAGISSRAAVDRVERLVQPDRVGHAGTLDPLATGVLVVCVGQATRLIRFAQQMPKTYRATFRLGCRSETDDIGSELVPAANAGQPTQAAVEEALVAFVGEIQQRPPAHSAIQVAGRRAYELARRGIAVDLKPRAVTIHSITINRYAHPELEIEVVCGSGTYIRSLGRDLGETLGTGAVMSALERTAIGPFTEDEALRLDDLTAEGLTSRLHPAITALPNHSRVTLTEAQLLEIRHGRPILTAWLNVAPTASDLAALDPAGNLAAILYEKRPGELWPRMNFSDSSGR